MTPFRSTRESIIFAWSVKTAARGEKAVLWDPVDSKPGAKGARVTGGPIAGSEVGTDLCDAIAHIGPKRWGGSEGANLTQRHARHPWHSAEDGRAMPFTQGLTKGSNIGFIDFRVSRIRFNSSNTSIAFRATLVSGLIIGSHFGHIRNPSFFQSAHSKQLSFILFPVRLHRPTHSNNRGCS